MKKMRACCVPCCLGEKFDLVHKFPADEERAAEWRRVLAIPALDELPLATIRKRYFVCTRHFRDSDYKNVASRGINVNVVPSLNLVALVDTEGLKRKVPRLHEKTATGPTLPEGQLMYMYDTVGAVGHQATGGGGGGATDPVIPAAHVTTMLAESIPAPSVGLATPLPVAVADKRPRTVMQLSDGTLLFKASRPKRKYPLPSKRRKQACEPVVTKTELPTVVLDDDPEPVPVGRPAAQIEEAQTDGNTTRVLALLECTPANLERLQRKLQSKGGNFVLNERLLLSDDDATDEGKARDKAMDDSRLFLTIKNANTSEKVKVSYVWLRDHCRCKECYNEVTHQRILSILDIPDDIVPESYEILDSEISILWKDGHRSLYQLPSIFEAQVTHLRQTLTEERSRMVLWDAATVSGEVSSVARVTLNQLLCEDAAVKQLVNSLVRYGVAFIEKVPPNQHSTEMAVTRMFPVHRTLFGEMWTFSDSRMDHSDTAYTNGYLGPHTDNTYFNDASGLQVLHCIQFNGTGGETFLIDGFHVVERLRQQNPEAYERLCRYPLEAEYKEEGKHHRHTAAVIRRHAITEEIEQLRFNPYDRAIMKTLPADEVPQFYADYKLLASLMEDDTLRWKFQLTPGVVMIFDNWRVLHGRQAYTGKRVMTGCYVSRTEYQSMARTQGLIS